MKREQCLMRVPSLLRSGSTRKPGRSLPSTVVSKATSNAWPSSLSSTATRRNVSCGSAARQCTCRATWVVGCTEEGGFAGCLCWHYGAVRCRALRSVRAIAAITVSPKRGLSPFNATRFVTCSLVMWTAGNSPVSPQKPPIEQRETLIRGDDASPAWGGTQQPVRWGR